MKYRKMHTQLSLYIIIIVIVTVVISSILYYYRSSNIHYKETLDQTQISIETGADYIKSYLVNLKRISEVIAMHPDTIAYIEGDLEAEKGLRALMDLSYSGDENILSIAIVLRDGSLISSGSVNYETQSKDMMEEAWYMDAKNSHQMPSLNSLRRTELTMDKENWVISMSREIVNSKQEHLGVLLIDLDYSFLENYIENIALGQDGYAFVIENTGQVVYHPDTSYFISESKRKELVAICDLEEGSETEGLITFKSNIEESEWILVGLASLDGLQAIRSSLLETNLVVILGMFIIGVLLAIMVSRKITSPFKLLIESMQDVSESWSKVSLKHEYLEVNTLVNEYNRMIDAIKSLMETIKQNEKSMAQFKFDALESQINPHFLYNTLDTIVWLSEFRDHEKAIEVTKALSKLLRVSLRSDTLILLDQEIDHVESYLKIQKTRYEDLDYVISATPQARALMVPKIILQPLVENSIYHGIKEGLGKGVIEINASVENDLIIEIKDNGIGFDINSSDKKRIGLENVNQRISLLFGDTYGLAINSAIEKGTTVRINLPVNFE